MVAALRQAGAGWITKLSVVREGVVKASTTRKLGSRSKGHCAKRQGQRCESRESPQWGSHRAPFIFYKKTQGKVCCCDQV